jgi:hypothetical protein
MIPAGCIARDAATRFNGAMATLLIKLNGAPSDEVEELRQLLTDHHIDFYETDAGRWGISVAALWLNDDAQLQQARNLIDEYQQQRSLRVRAEHESQRQAGTHETHFLRFKREPVTVAFYLLLIVIILYLTLMPFIGAL